MYQGDAPPIFNLEGINFAYLKKQSNINNIQAFI
jgi:hypothetical protein